MNEPIGVVSPEGLPPRASGSISPPLASLDGKTICEVYNNHFKGELMFRTYRRLFAERYRDTRVIAYDEFPIVYVGSDPATQRQVAKQIAALARERGCDALITGNGG